MDPVQAANVGKLGARKSLILRERSGLILREERRQPRGPPSVCPPSPDATRVQTGRESSFLVAEAECLSKRF